MQQTFCPTDYGFEFTADGWYKFDRKSATVAARKARDAEAKRLRAAGYDVSVFSLPGQLIRCGGIGSGNPDIELVVNCYGLNAYERKLEPQLPSRDDASVTGLEPMLTR